MTVEDQLLQEIDATIVVTDVRGFTALAHQLGPVELGLTLSGFYAHTGGICEKHGGRIVKFIGDSVLAAFLGMQDHRGRALAAIGEMAERRDQWMADNVKVKLPPLEYAASAASGEVLVGELGTERIRFWDVLGAPVNLAFRLGTLATDRRVANLVYADTIERAAARPEAWVEVEGAELGGRRHRLYRIGR